MKILYVEDEMRLALAVAQVLKKNGYCVDLAYDGDTGLEKALTDTYDFIVLDIMLPKRDGVSVLKTLRSQGIDTPVILLTAKGDLESKVRGLDSGADDYLPKPFASEELLARLRALARRKGTLLSDNLLRVGDLELNPHSLDLYGPHSSFHLTQKESQLMELLIANANTAVSLSLIIDKLWGYDQEAEERHVRVHVTFLRKKLALLTDKVSIRTIRGVGYKLECC